VKVSIPVGSSGIYHEKVGIVTDEAGGRIAFSGSVNETAGGWLNNRESFKVHRSWREAEFVDYDVDAGESGFDIDATVEESLDLRPLPEPALTLGDLDRAIQIARARPPEVDFRPLDPGSYGLGMPGGASIRVTTDPGVFEFSSDNFQLFSPGGGAFGCFCVDGAGGGAEGRGIAWMVQRPGAETEFVVATRFGPRRVESFAELLAALDVIGEPCQFPFADWPGVSASVLA
jgi:hypothetical protein